MPYRPVDRSATIRRWTNDSLNLPSRKPLSKAVQAFDRLRPGEIDQRPRTAEHGDLAEYGSVDQLQPGGGVHPMADSLHIAAAHDRDVERRLEPVAVEAVQCGRRGTARPDLAADVEHQSAKFRRRTGRSTGESERVGADLDEGTARDPAPKLCVGDPDAVRLPS